MIAGRTDGKRSTGWSRQHRPDNEGPKWLLQKLFGASASSSSSNTRHSEVRLLLPPHVLYCEVSGEGLIVSTVCSNIMQQEQNDVKAAQQVSIQLQIQFLSCLRLPLSDTANLALF